MAQPSHTFGNGFTSLLERPRFPLEGEIFFYAAEALNHEVVVFVLLPAFPFGVMLAAKSDAIFRVEAGGAVTSFKEVGAIGVFSKATGVQTMFVSLSNVEGELAVCGVRLP